MRKHVELPLKNFKFSSVETCFNTEFELGMISNKVLSTRFIHIVALFEFFGMKDEVKMAKELKNKLTLKIKESIETFVPLIDAELNIVKAAARAVGTKPTNSNVKRLLTICIALTIPLKPSKIWKLTVGDISLDCLQFENVTVTGWRNFRVILLCVDFLNGEDRMNSSTRLIDDWSNTFTKRISRIFGKGGAKRLMRGAINDHKMVNVHESRDLPILEAIPVLLKSRELKEVRTMESDFQYLSR